MNLKELELKTHGGVMFSTLCFCYSEQSEEHKFLRHPNHWDLGIGSISPGYLPSDVKVIKATENTYSLCIWY